ncbi:MAG: NAD(P)H-quinone oxidoreductase [Gammaproteobacteria bacterium]
MHQGSLVKTVVITQPGGPEVLKLSERPQPEPAGDEILVRVAGAGINRADLLQRAGGYPPPPGVVVDVPGLEYAGEVTATGPKAQCFAPGDRVMGLVPGGAYAEYLCVPEATAMRVPEGMDLVAAAAIPEAFLTSYRALFLKGELEAGESVLIRAATSGVGLAAVQLAAFAGATVLAGSRQPDRLPSLEELGAAVAFEDCEDGARKVVGSAGADLALEFLGGRYFTENLELLRSGGRLVLIGLLAGREASLDLGAVLTRQLHIHAFTMRSLPAYRRADITQRFALRFLPAFESGRLHPVVGATYPLTDAAQAHTDMQDGKVSGKLILVP